VVCVWYVCVWRRIHASLVHGVCVVRVWYVCVWWRIRAWRIHESLVHGVCVVCVKVASMCMVRVS
jgi:hypothetical protein